MPNVLSWRPKRSVKTRLVLVQASLTVFLVAILAAFLYFPTKGSIETASNQAYIVLANNLVATVFSSLAKDDSEAIIAAAKRIEGVKGVSYVLVSDETNQVIYDSLHELEDSTLEDQTTRQVMEVKNVIKSKSTRNGENFYQYSAPFLINNKPAAIVRIAVAEKSITGEFNKLRLIFIRISALVTLLGVVISYLISVRITAPIRRLTENALAIRAGNLEVATDVRTNDEMEQLAREFRRMVDQLKVFYLKEVREKEKAIEDMKRIEHINEQLRELDRRKNEFLSIASHQLRTPLSVILWTVSLIKESDLSHIPPEKRRLLDETEKNARLMEKLISELLDLSKLQRSKRKVVITQLDIIVFAKTILESFQTLAKTKGIKLAFEKGSKPIPKISSDDNALRHIISNLIDNAIRYTPEKGSVSLRIDFEDEAIFIRVKDTGIGISAEEQTRIFSQFTRGERAMRISPDGSGLGLYLVKQMVESLNGEISVQSQVGEGSTFQIKIPLKLIQAVVQDAVTEDKKSPTAAQPLVS